MRSKLMDGGGRKAELVRDLEMRVPHLQRVKEKTRQHSRFFGLAPVRSMQI